MEAAADIDVFPDTIVRDWQDWELLEFPYEEEILQSLPFISYLMANHGNGRFFPEGYNRIRYRMIPSTHATRTNHQYTLNNLSVRAEDTSWFEVDRRIRKDPNRTRSAAPAEEEEENQSQHRRRRHHGRPRPYHPRPQQHHSSSSSKMDVTLAFRHRNVFTTKKMFTFGTRNVALDTCHVYQTKAYPLLVYLPKPYVHISNRDRTFACTHYRNYVPHLIPPNSVVKIQHPSFYVLLTAGKVLFAVDVVDVHVIPDIEVAHGIRIQDQLQRLSPPKPKPSLPSSSWIEGPSVIPLPVEWDRKSGKIKQRPPPPPKLNQFAWPPAAAIAPPPPPVVIPPPPPPVIIEPRPGPSWKLTDWEKSHQPKKNSPITIILSDDEEEEDTIFIPRLEPLKEEPLDIVSSPDVSTVLESLMLDLGAEEAQQLLKNPENFFQSQDILEQAFNAAELYTGGEEPLSSEQQQQVTTIDFQDLQNLYKD